MKSKLSLIALILIQSAFAQTINKTLLIEEFTTTLCGNCPPVSHELMAWHEQHPDNSILVVVHAGFGEDIMTGTPARTLFRAFAPTGFGFAPAVLLNRTLLPWLDSVPYLSVYRTDTVYDRMIEEPAHADINISGWYNFSSRTIHARVDTRFLTNVEPGNYRISLMLTEDSVLSTTDPAYDQKCYSPDFANTHYPGMFNPDEDKIKGYPHRYVLREQLLGPWGVTAKIPFSSAPPIGTVYSADTNFVVPDNYNINRLRLVALVSKYNPYLHMKHDKYVLNAKQTRLKAVFSTATPENARESDNIGELLVFPVPTTDQLHVSYGLRKQETVSMHITDMLGQATGIVVPKSTQMSGTQNLSIDVSSLSKGIYFLNIDTDSQHLVRKLIIQ